MKRRATSQRWHMPRDVLWVCDPWHKEVDSP